ncbi:Integrase catalytic domain-containing protein [Fagus crenata]
MTFLSQIEPKNINEAIEDESWILAMQEELNQFERNKVWSLAPRPKDHSVIGTKWVFRNKKDEEGIIVRNKARLVAQGYNQEEEFSKTMQDEFEMSMMGELKFFLGLQIKQTEDGIFLNQSKYVIDLLKRFGLTNAKAYGTPMSPSTKLDKDEKGKPVDVKLYRVKRIFRYLLGTIDLGLWYPKSNSFDLISYSDADFAGCKIDRKSTSGTCHFLGHSLVSWFSKKQNSVALSTAEAEYVAAGSCCAQSLYIKQQLEDFKILFDHIPIRCDNTSAISLSKNPIQHSRTKHIEIRYHFIRDHVQKGDIELEFVSTDSQWADILTKPLIEERFCTIRREIGMARYVDIK